MPSAKLGAARDKTQRAVQNKSDIPRLNMAISSERHGTYTSEVRGFTSRMRAGSAPSDLLAIRGT